MQRLATAAVPLTTRSLLQRAGAVGVWATSRREIASVGGRTAETRQAAPTSTPSSEAPVVELGEGALPVREQGRTFRPRSTYTLNQLDETDFMPHMENPSLANLKYDVFKAMKKDPLKEYKDSTLLSYFITEAGSLMNRHQTSLSAKNQRKLSKAVRRARAMGLLPYMYRPEQPRYFRKGTFP